MMRAANARTNEESFPKSRGGVRSPLCCALACGARNDCFRDYSLAEEGPVKMKTESIPPFRKQRERIDWIRAKAPSDTVFFV